MFYGGTFGKYKSIQFVNNLVNICSLLFCFDEGIDEACVSNYLIQVNLAFGTRFTVSSMCKFFRNNVLLN